MNRLKDIDLMSEQELHLAMEDAERKYVKVSHQISLLDDQIHHLRKLFRRAEKNNSHAIRYNLRMQLSISSGVKVMYHQYASTVSTRIDHLRVKINQWNAHTSLDSPDSPEPEPVVTDNPVPSTYRVIIGAERR